jgi:prepilin-type N-terminal cleavage/methylation domain-containing protein
MHRLLHRREGFSLLEVLIALLILGIALGSMAALAIQSSNTMTRNQNLAFAANLAELKLEELRNELFADLEDGEDGPLNSNGETGSGKTIFSRSWEINNDVPIAGMKEIVVTVTWDQVGGQQTYTLRGVRGQ